MLGLVSIEDKKYRIWHSKLDTITLRDKSAVLSVLEKGGFIIGLDSVFSKLVSELRVCYERVEINDCTTFYDFTITPDSESLCLIYKVIMSSGRFRCISIELNRNDAVIDYVSFLDTGVDNAIIETWRLLQGNKDIDELKKYKLN